MVLYKCHILFLLDKCPEVTDVSTHWDTIGLNSIVIVCFMNNNTTLSNNKGRFRNPKRNDTKA